MKVIKAVEDLNSAKHIILPFVQDTVDYELISQITGIQGKPDFQGKLKQINTLPSVDGTKVLYLVGLGTGKHLSERHEAFRWISHKRNRAWQDHITLYLDHLEEDDLYAAIYGLVLSKYDLGAYKTDHKTKNAFLNAEVECFVYSRHFNEDLALEARAAARTVNAIKALVDAPANIKTPEYLANWAVDSAKRFGFSTKVFDKEMLEQGGFQALLAVGQGSRFEPRLIQMEYKPETDGDYPTLALVGKGITFDTGGLSIKPSDNMHHMKSDMGGAAAVLGTMELVAKLKLPIHLIGVVASAENAVDANSLKPGDIINSYSGKTIEVIDTDAEGRLVLADAINYAIKEFNPDKVIDLATLTGSAIGTLGYTAAAMFSNNEDMTDALLDIGYETHERVWQLPLFDDFKSDLHSDVADVRNYSGKPIAGAITAAKFLEVFTEDHPAWLHLDIAGVAFGSSSYAKMQCATGYGVRLLTEYIKSLS
ncbi:MAG: leucyl aminopeptidase family protein [Roseivirga sp.]|uniref:leucyl aminopeptidase family protein n=1 Tax=Roseivirga sp. TaxID=1964215 RepID=UPI001B2C4ECC|nr:leucyl aminopeptidase family protein [Roseivirga sp.]MBO6496175.1 leucyl aminopeptidase family protein [Roseivirga sp.]